MKIEIIEDLQHLDTLVGGLKKYADLLEKDPSDVFARAEIVTDLDRAERASAALLDLAWSLRKTLQAVTP